MTTKNFLKLEVLLRIPGLILLVIFFLTQTAHCQNWVEERTYVSNGTTTPRVDGLFTHPLHRNLGTFVWFQVQQDYSQAYGGITYAPTSWIQFALGLGLEQYRQPARVGSYVWMGKGKCSALAVFEYGGSGFWYKVEGNFQITKTLGLGVNLEHFRGGGPKVEYSVPRTHVKFWFSPMVLNGSVRPLVGIRYSL